MNKAPGPGLRETFKLMKNANKDIISVYQKLFDLFGDSLELKVGSARFFLTRSPKAIQEMFIDKVESFEKYEMEMMKAFLGQGMFTAKRKSWMSQRKRLQPAFSAQNLRRSIEVMERAADEVIGDMIEEAKNNDEQIDLFPYMIYYALRVTGIYFVDVDTKQDFEKISEAFHKVLEHCHSSGRSALRLLDYMPVFGPLKTGEKLEALVPSKSKKGFQDGLEVLDDHVFGVIERYKTGEKRDNLFVDLLLKNLDLENPEHQKLARDELVTIFFAGHETTALGINNALFYLIQDQEGLEAVRNEYIPFSEAPLGFEAMPKMKVSESSFLESIRLHPPLWRMARVAQTDTDLDGYTIKKGTVAVTCPYLIHREESVFTNPNEFQYDRFVKTNYKKIDRTKYFPFGLGERSCVGSMFSILEAQVLLSKLVHRFDFEIVTPERPTFDFKVSLRPAEKIILKLKERS